MAAGRHHQNQQFPRQVDPAIWRACAGTSVQIPAFHSKVYYFPQGHLEHSSNPHSLISTFSPLPTSLRPFIPCRVIQILFLADPDTDEVFARIRPQPLSNNELRAFFAAFRLAVGKAGGADGKGERGGATVVSFLKALTPSDANNGGGFSVPRCCADSIFQDSTTPRIRRSRR